MISIVFVKHSHLSDNAISGKSRIILVREALSMKDGFIKQLRESRGLTQTELARRLGITRSSVNSWEMGISSPSTKYIIELARIFHVSTDYLLGIDSSSALNTAGLPEEDIHFLHQIAEYLRTKSKKG